MFAAIRRSSFVGSFAAAGFIDPTQTVHIAFTSLNWRRKRRRMRQRVGGESYAVL
jgi:hypothetical protein